MKKQRGVVVVAALALAACGGDDDSAGEATPPLPATIPPAPSTPAGTVTPTPSAAATPAPSGGTAAPASTAAPGSTSAATGTPTTPAGTATPTTAAPVAVEPAATPTEIATVNTPVDLAWREGDDGLFVVEQDGRIMRLGDAEPTMVLDVSDLTSAEGERGLLGLAFEPGGEVAYINYTDNDGNTVVAEYPVDPDGTFRTGDEARTVLQVEQPYANHNGGGLEFGPDGFLYIGMGDGGDGGDPERRATNPAELLGKMLRIDPAIGDGQPYTVPADNPFVGRGDTAPEIWSTGLRNPWRFSFDRETGDLWIADVGQNQFEEVDVAPATDGVGAGLGLFFGWSAFEGNEPYNDDVPTDGHTPPIFTYEHDAGDVQGCSISGGVRARGGPNTSLEGWYVFTDFCTGTVWALEVFGEGPGLAAGRIVIVAEGIDSPTAVVDGPDGSVYVLSANGPVLRLDPS